MSSHVFQSAFAKNIISYLAYRESLGFGVSALKLYLLSFDRYCHENGFDVFDRSTVEGWVACHEKVHINQARPWLSHIRDFGRYLRLSGITDAHVLSGSHKRKVSRPTPYLLSSAEIEAFFSAATTLAAKPPWSWQAKCFFGLMYALGLRTCEARRLTPENVNTESRYIDIVWSKGGGSRRLYITEEVGALLDDCDTRNRAFIGNKRQTFFINSIGNPVSGGIAADYFNRIWDASGLTRPVQGKQPRPYDFRHHFAYKNIERWTADGKDITAMAPYLARYMGHACFESTFYYIHTSPDYLAGYAASLQAQSDVLPEAGFDD